MVHFHHKWAKLSEDDVMVDSLTNEEFESVVKNIPVRNLQAHIILLVNPEHLWGINTNTKQYLSENKSQKYFANNFS